MIFPVVYAVVVWYLAMRWRRRWPSFAVVVMAVIVLGAVGITLRSMFMMAEFGSSPPPAAKLIGPFRHPVVEAIYWPYAAMVMAVGLFIACLPRTAPSEAHCRRCHYDLTEMDPEDLVCPECGVAQEFRCLACGCDLSGLHPVRLQCPDCCTVWMGPGFRGIPGLADPDTEPETEITPFPSPLHLPTSSPPHPPSPA